jgi:hypothetical protein
MPANGFLKDEALNNSSHSLSMPLKCGIASETDHRVRHFGSSIGASVAGELMEGWLGFVSVLSSNSFPSAGQFLSVR